MSLDAWSHDQPEPFIERYSAIEEWEWEDKLVRALHAPVQDGVAFPVVPPDDIQTRIHGNRGTAAIRESFQFYRLVEAFAKRLGAGIGPMTRLLDFGSGWGRAIWPFMARIPTRNLFGYEPVPLYCRLARILNPYVPFLGGDAKLADLDDRSLSLIVSWSFPTHSPLNQIRSWFAEFARILQPGGLVFVCAWGDRFIQTLMDQQDRAARGDTVHWYHREVLARIGDLETLRVRVQAGEMVFAPSLEDPGYGDTFMSPRAAQALNIEGFSLVGYDAGTLGQDLLVFQRV